MRLHPSVGLTMPRVIPAGGATIAGVKMPAGYRVGINSAVIQYDTNVFGTDVSEFKPERWLDSGGDVARMERTMLVFGRGARTCLGKHVSSKKLFSWLNITMMSSEY